MTEKLFQFWKNYNLKKKIERRIEKKFGVVMEQIKLSTLKNVEELRRQITTKESDLCNIRASKSDFAYQFTQSILKIINSLNMEVMDLKQKDLTDDFRLKKMTDGINVEALQQAYLKELEQISKFEIVETTVKHNRHVHEYTSNGAEHRIELGDHDNGMFMGDRKY